MPEREELESIEFGINVELLDGPAGLDSAVRATRLSHKGRKSADMDLMSRLVKAGDDHAKSLRGVVVWLHIKAPRYWWQEYVTYRVGNEQLGSGSTMHERVELSEEELVAEKSELPEGTLQTRIFMVSYQTLRRIYFARRHHRLPEWRQFCEFIESLPWADRLITVER